MLAAHGPVAGEEPEKVVAKTRHGRKFTEPEEMEVGQVTTALAQQLHIDDIDISDAENPQLCAEYVKEIYEYMRELEVSLNKESTSLVFNLFSIRESTHCLTLMETVCNMFQMFLCVL